MAALLELSGVSKHFGAIQALAGVSLALHAGEVVGLMGDNGAGKSTLVKIIAGNFPPSAGTMTMSGRPVAFHQPTDARWASAWCSASPCGPASPAPRPPSWAA